ncbi:hypothetical protein M5K25_017857 [Dendrobium thyrsiflorum]|uniref:Uncharacterized protein n=1 Tax=Dendrobium thyrsiflorum TaxID=117978 RepID=A0ABD0UH54_DENTH
MKGKEVAVKVIPKAKELYISKQQICDLRLLNFCDYILVGMGRSLQFAKAANASFDDVPFNQVGSSPIFCWIGSKNDDGLAGRVGLTRSKVGWVQV